MSDVSQMLDAVRAGRAAPADLLPLVYDELRRLAASRLAHERPDHTLQATALVHEAFLRIGTDQSFENRAHFFSAAAEAMRRILVDAARRKARAKHGGSVQRVNLDEATLVAPEPRHDLVALDTALVRLAGEDPQAAKLVELRYFAGLSVPEAAELLGVSPRTADRLWAYARAWLYRELTAEFGP